MRFCGLLVLKNSSLVTYLILWQLELPLSKVGSIFWKEKV